MSTRQNLKLKNEIEQVKIHQDNSTRKILALLKETLIANNEKMDIETLKKNEPMARKILDLEKQLC